MTGISPDAHAVTTRREKGAVWITIDRPRRLNAFAGTMRDDLAEAVEQAAAERDVRVIVLTGSGRAFSAGADLDGMIDLLERADEDGFRRNVEAGSRVVRAIATAPQPVIAALNGVAVGAGAALAIAADLRIASSTATIGFTFNRIGLHPDWGATHFLPRLVGWGRAWELFSSARILTAAEAAGMGLVGEVVEHGEFEARVAELVRETAARPPLPLAATKRSLLAAAGGVEALDQALRREADAQIACFRSQDVREGVAAFRERRAPLFTGH